LANNDNIVDNDEEELSYDKNYRNLSELFSAPDLNDIGSDLDPKVTNFNNLWIFLWIFKY
jgi:hypothetical protein